MPGGSVLRQVKIRQEYSVKSSLFVPIVYKHHRRNPQRLLAFPAGARLALQVLEESVREVIRRPRPSRSFGALCAAMRAGVLDYIFQRIAIQSGPASIANSYRFNG